MSGALPALRSARGSGTPVGTGSHLAHRALPVAVGLAAGGAAVASASAPPRYAGLLVAAATVPLLAVLLGDLRRVLLALVLLDIPLARDVNISYTAKAAQYGAFYGYNLSVTTICLAGLYGLWLADALAPRTRAPRAGAADRAAVRGLRAVHRAVGPGGREPAVQPVRDLPRDPDAAGAGVRREQRAHPARRALRGRAAAARPDPRERRRHRPGRRHRPAGGDARLAERGRRVLRVAARARALGVRDAARLGLPPAGPHGLRARPVRAVPHVLARRLVGDAAVARHPRR